MRFDQHLIFENISFEVLQGDFFCIVGPNGSGKTTLLKILLGQLTPTSGQVQRQVDNSKIGYVPQFRNLDIEYPLSARSFVALKLSHSLIPWLSRSERQLVQNSLAQVHLTSKSSFRVGQMSGGEKQRAYLAQAIVNQPEILILDEPTASLDEHAKFLVMDVVQELNDRGTTVILISHDSSVLQRFGKHKLELTGAKD
ncbi:metal ABC transporter ATP-binding protein [Bombilactobacillus thymidiniphilus]|uniref:metal ABC transporter ATP-binding protein n=1 Tax=Bombilactobacillus thymidiniphilus TaxID=2923363 RepID=UPI0021AD84B2|nr:ATP-binding cassette domain-containing protein [Bombilactobacillus thymidiniphilus]